MSNTDRINYNRIALAQAFYKGRGYSNVETPWLVAPAAVRATQPIPIPIMESVRGVLVNSGEQSFIQQMIDGTLVPGMYQTTTPCFHNAEDHDSPYFYGVNETRPYSFQVELLLYKPDDVRVCYEKAINDAMACFFEISDVDTFDATQTAEGFDIAVNGIVLGSYGIRKMNDHVWVYGTGLVEPRFSLAVHSLIPETPNAPEAYNEQPEHTEEEKSNLLFMAQSDPDPAQAHKGDPD
jgi:hypothetical protein